MLSSDDILVLIDIQNKIVELAADEKDHGPYGSERDYYKELEKLKDLRAMYADAASREREADAQATVKQVSHQLLQKSLQTKTPRYEATHISADVCRFIQQTKS